MKGSLNFLISTDNPYLNSRKVGDKELILNTEITERDAQFVNRVGKVVGVPLHEHTTEIQKGDLVIVHHNVFRVWYDMRQELQRSASFIEDDLYTVDKDQIFAYKRDGGVWEALEGFSFVKPIANTDKWNPDAEVALKGELYFGNKHTNALGIYKGDTVGFTPNSEYEFVIDGVRLYRVYTHDLNIKFYDTGKGNTEDNLFREEGVGAVG